MRSALQLDFLSPHQRNTAQEVLGKCVHCGFCNATCPTYRILGDELDGPRGRIYQIKNVLEGTSVSASFQHHLDRCLTCRNCETTCPSGVEYGKLLDIGRHIARKKGPPVLWHRRLLEWLVLVFLPYPNRLKPFLRIAQFFSPVLPKKLSQKIPLIGEKKRNLTPLTTGKRKVLIPGGCVQSLAQPNTVDACIRIFNQFGVHTVTNPNQCCGAIAQHLGSASLAEKQMIANISIWEEALENGVENIIITASGCGVTVKEYPHLLADTIHKTRAQKISDATLDMCEWLNPSMVKERFNDQLPLLKVAFQSPCSLQHGQKITGKIEALLQAVNCELLPVKDAHLCCGSAGTYSLFQPDLSDQLLMSKVSNLQETQCDLIVTANVGCHLSLQARSSVPVKHWIEVIDERLKQA